MINAIIHFCSSITLIEKIISLLESLFIFWIIVSKHLMNIISSILSSKNHMYCHMWCLNVNVKNFKFNLHHLNSAQIWLRSCLNLIQTSCLNLIQMWLKCILILLCIITLNCISSFFCLNLTQILFKSDSDILFKFDSNISFKSDSNVTQMCFNFIMHHHVKMHLISSRFTLQTSCLNLTQMWLRFILVSSVLHHIKMHSHQFSSYFSFHLQFFLISSCFFSSSCRSSVLKREVTVMMLNH